jgi:putative two-component system response regulator
MHPVTRSLGAGDGLGAQRQEAYDFQRFHRSHLVGPSKRVPKMTMTARHLESRILIVDDEVPNVKLLERVLARAGYINVKSITDSRETVSLYSQWQPDLILCDLHMPHLDGFDVMEQLGLRSQHGAYVPLIVLTADVSTKVRERALEMGATDFLLKPFDHTEVLLRIKNVLRTRLLQLELEDRVRERTQELDEARHEVLEHLALAAEYRDDDTHQHTWRVGQMSALLAQLLGLGENEVELIRSAAPLHDVGKIGISDLILLKPGRLTFEEFEIMKTHTTIGVKILSRSAHSVLQLAAEIALTHHERWDGTGYLHGLRERTFPCPVASWRLPTYLTRSPTNGPTRRRGRSLKQWLRSAGRRGASSIQPLWRPSSVSTRRRPD